MTCNLDGGSRTKSEVPKKLWVKKLTPPLLALFLALGSVLSLQAQSEDHSTRKITHEQKPNYPEILKVLSIGGKVRLKVKVLANGTVANAEILGGNPILAESAVKAVMAWKYAPASSTTFEIATFDFSSH